MFTLLLLRFNCSRCGAFLPSPKNGLRKRSSLLLRSSDFSCNKYQHQDALHSQKLLIDRLRFHVSLNTKQVIWEMFFRDNIWTESECTMVSNHYISHSMSAACLSHSYWWQRVNWPLQPVCHARVIQATVMKMRNMSFLRVRYLQSKRKKQRNYMMTLHSSNMPALSPCMDDL